MRPGRVQTPLRNMESTAMTNRELKAGEKASAGVSVLLSAGAKGEKSDWPSLALSRRQEAASDEAQPALTRLRIAVYPPEGCQRVPRCRTSSAVL